MASNDVAGDISKTTNDVSSVSIPAPRSSGHIHRLRKKKKIQNQEDQFSVPTTFGPRDPQKPPPASTKPIIEGPGPLHVIRTYVRQKPSTLFSAVRSQDVQILRRLVDEKIKTKMNTGISNHEEMDHLVKDDAVKVEVDIKRTVPETQTAQPVCASNKNENLSFEKTVGTSDNIQQPVEPISDIKTIEKGLKNVNIECKVLKEINEAFYQAINVSCYEKNNSLVSTSEHHSPGDDSSDMTINQQIIVVLLEAGADANVQFMDCPVIHIAVGSGVCEIVELLVKYGADIDKEDCNGTSAMHLAARNADITMLKLIKKHTRKNMDAKSSLFGRTSLHEVVMKQNMECLQYLLDINVDVNAMDNIGQTALHMAAQNGSYNIVQDLLKHGASTNLLDKEGNPAWMYAIYHGVELLKLFWDSWDLAWKHPLTGNMVLHEICKGSNLTVLKQFLDLGCDPMALNNKGENILMFAAKFAQFHVIHYLIDEKHITFDVNAHNKEGLTLLYHILANSSPLSIKLPTLNLLLKGGLKVTSQGLRHGGTLITDNIESIQTLNWLLENGDDPNIVLSNGNNSLWKAVKSSLFYHGDISLSDCEALQGPLQKLMLHNTDIKTLSAVKGPDGLTPLQNAILARNIKLTIFLIENGFSTKYLKEWLSSKECKHLKIDDQMNIFIEGIETNLLDSAQVRKLKIIAREEILSSIGPRTNVRETIATLPIPKLLIDFLDPAMFDSSDAKGVYTRQQSLDPWESLHPTFSRNADSEIRN